METDIVARRMRVHLMADIECVARASEPAALHDTELGEELLAFAEAEHGCIPALTADEAATAKSLANEIEAMWEQARRLKQNRIGGKVAHGPEPADLVSLGWFEKVQPLAQSTFAVFQKRGWLNEGL